MWMEANPQRREPLEAPFCSKGGKRRAHAASRRRASIAFAAWLLLGSVGRAQGTGTQVSGDFDRVVADAATARAAGDLPRAIDLYARAVQLDPRWPDGWWYLGSLQYGVGSYAPARDALTHFIELTPHAGPATALRGLCEFETGEYPQALKDVRDGLAAGAASQPRNEHILRAHEALLLTRNGKFEGALGAYAFFARDGAPDPEMAVGIGLAALREPLLPKEVPPERRALFADAGNATFHFIEGDASEAEKSFQMLFQRYPTAANLHYVYGYFLFPIDPERAANEFKRELDISPRNAAAEAILAWAALMHEDSVGALPYARKAVADDPTLPLAQLVLGRSMVDSGDLNGGMAHLERALQLDPDNLESHLALAGAYSEAGRDEDARRERQQSLAITRDQPVAHP